MASYRTPDYIRKPGSLDRGSGSPEAMTAQVIHVPKKIGVNIIEDRLCWPPGPIYRASPTEHAERLTCSIASASLGCSVLMTANRMNPSETPAFGGRPIASFPKGKRLGDIGTTVPS